jgi:hypothetical protein
MRLGQIVVAPAQPYQICKVIMAAGSTIFHVVGIIALRTGSVPPGILPAPQTATIPLHHTVNSLSVDDTLVLGRGSVNSSQQGRSSGTGISWHRCALSSLIGANSIFQA